MTSNIPCIIILFIYKKDHDFHETNFDFIAGTGNLRRAQAAPRRPVSLAFR
jgi:hypothetical protein